MGESAVKTGVGTGAGRFFSILLPGFTSIDELGLLAYKNALNKQKMK